MDSLIKPSNDSQVREAVAWALSENKPLAVRGGGSKMSLGRPSNIEATLDLSSLSGVIGYEPSELVLTAKSGTLLSEISSLLRSENQEMAFEPPDLGPLFGSSPGQATLGGVIACNLSGPRRVRAGAARDHFLGMHAISGRAEIFKAGGKVVKNVTGYDLCKLVAGSYGTLAVLTEITIKVLPRSQKTRTVLIFGLSDKAGINALCEVVSSIHEPTGLAHLPTRITKHSKIDFVNDSGKSVTAIRLEGPEPSVLSRCETLRQTLGRLGTTEELHGKRSNVFWNEVGNVFPFVSRPQIVVWRILVAPTDAVLLTQNICSQCDAECYYDWAGGIIWLGTKETDLTTHEIVRRSVKAVGAQATMFRADANIRAALPVFEPLPDPLHKVTARIKQSFDPKGILNPGRLYADI